MKEKYIATLAVVCIVTLIRQNRKLNRTIKVLDTVVDIVDKMIDMDIQESTDKAFDEIVDHYE
jgi:hypothetical protein